MNIKKHLDLLGMRAVDRVTGFTGVISSICFDLYGCVQATVSPSTDKGKIADSHYFDVQRLKITHREPVMDRPNFDYGPQALGLQGAAEKPVWSKP